MWEPWQIRAAIAKAKELGYGGAALAIEIIYDTSLRPGDATALTWTQYDGESLWLIQGKTGRPLRVPLWPETIAAIETYKTHLGVVPLAATPLLRTPKGRPYTSYHLAHQVRGIMRAAGLPDDLQIRDLRRTASKERAEGGASEAELAAATGHSIARGSAILDVYNPRSYELARRAQDKRRRNKNRPKV